MKLKLKLSLFLLLAVTYLSGQTFYKGTLTFVNGEVKNGFVAPPKDANQKNILFKSNEGGKKEKIPNESLSLLSMESENGKTLDFEYCPTAQAKGKSTKKYWLFVTVKGYATLYLMSTYRIDRNGNAYTVYYAQNSHDQSMFPYYLRKKGENVAFFFAYTSPSHMIANLNTFLKKSASLYLTEDPELVKRIERKELTHRNLEEIINIYNDFMSNSK
jgi:hypothetical protein